MAETDFRHIVRIVNTDLDGNEPILAALRKIKGVGFMFSNMVCSIAGVPKNKKAGDLLDEEIKKLDEVIREPGKYHAPSWMLNRRKDMDDGSDKHLTTTDLTFNRDNDIRMMQKMKCYKGVRHSLGQPVRGQRTKSNFRVNKGKVQGVIKKKVGAPAAEKE